jgi:hypothetical protein
MSHANFGLELFDAAKRAPHFNGPAYSPALDHARLTGQIQRVYRALSGGQWLTLGEIAELTSDPEASVSAQLRHLRKERFGSHVIVKRRRGEPANGLWEYRMVIAT